LSADIRQLSAKNFEKQKYLSLQRIFAEYKNEEKTHNFSKETALAAMIDMLIREKLTQAKSIMLDQ